MMRVYYFICHCEPHRHCEERFSRRSNPFMSSYGLLRLLRSLAMTTVFFPLFSLSSCSLLSPNQSEPTTFYILQAPSPPVVKSSHYQKTLLVTKMQADNFYNTTQMAYTTQPYQIAYFAYHRWADTPANMLQSQMMEALKSTRRFQVVGTFSPGVRYDYILNTQLLEIQQVFSPQASFVHLRVNAQWVNAASHRVIATKQFSVIEKAPQRTPYGGAIAANQAMDKMLRQLVGWVECFLRNPTWCRR